MFCDGSGLERLYRPEWSMEKGGVSGKSSLLPSQGTERGRKVTSEKGSI